MIRNCKITSAFVFLSILGLTAKKKVFLLKIFSFYFLVSFSMMWNFGFLNTWNMICTWYLTCLRTSYTTQNSYVLTLRWYDIRFLIIEYWFYKIHRTFQNYFIDVHSEIFWDKISERPKQQFWESGDFEVSSQLK